MARMLATKMNKVLLEYHCQEFLCKYLGEGEEKLNEAFVKASEMDAVLFFDEIDTIASNRDDCEDIHFTSLTNALIVNFNKFSCTVVGATNRLHRIDKALLRHGRFEQVLHVSNPTTEDRRMFLQFLLPFSKLDFEELAKATIDYSLAKLKFSVDEALLNQAMDKSKYLSIHHFNVSVNPMYSYLKKKYFPFDNLTLFCGKNCHLIAKSVCALFNDAVLISQFPVHCQAKVYVILHAFNHVQYLTTFIEQCQMDGKIIVAFEQYNYDHLQYLFSKMFFVDDDLYLKNLCNI